MRENDAFHTMQVAMEQKIDALGLTYAEEFTGDDGIQYVLFDYETDKEYGRFDTLTQMAQFVQTLDVTR